MTILSFVTANVKIVMKRWWIKTAIKSSILIGIVVMGIDVVLLPFTTPETINFLGYKKSKFAGRISGILLIVVGVWMWFIQ